MIRKRYALSCVPNEVKGRIVSLSLLLAAFLLPGLSHAQTARSDSLYSLGMEAFARKDYKKAERLFRLTWEEDSLTMPVTAFRREYSQDWLYHTLWKQGRVEEAYDGTPYPDIPPTDRRRSMKGDGMLQEAYDALARNDRSGVMLAELKFMSALREMEREFGSGSLEAGQMSLGFSNFYLSVGEGDAAKAVEYARNGQRILDAFSPKLKSYRLFLPLAQGAEALSRNQADQAFAYLSSAREFCRGNMKYLEFQYAHTLRLYDVACHMRGDTTSLASAYRIAEDEYRSLPLRHRRKCLDALMAVLDYKASVVDTVGMNELIDEGLLSCAVMRDEGRYVWGWEMRLYAKQAGCAYYAGDADRVMERSDLVLSIAADHPEVPQEDMCDILVMRMQALAATKRYREAIGEAARIIEIAGNNEYLKTFKLQAMAAMADAYYAIDDHQKAAECYEDIEREVMRTAGLDPINKVMAYQRLAMMAVSSGMIDRQLEYCRKGVEVFEKNGMDLLNTVYFEMKMGLAGHSDNDDDSALVSTYDALERLIDDNPDADPAVATQLRAGIRMMRASWLAGHNRKQEALPYAEDGVRMLEEKSLPVGPDYYLTLCMALSGSYDIDRLEPYIDKLLESARATWGDKSIGYADALLYAADIYSFDFNMAKVAETLDKVSAIIEANDNNFAGMKLLTCMVRLAGFYAQNNEPEKGLAVIEKAELYSKKMPDPGFSQLWLDLHRINCYAKLGRNNDGRELLRSLLAQYKGEMADDESKMMFYGSLGSLANIIGMLVESSECFENVLAVTGGDLKKCSYTVLSQLHEYPYILNQFGETDRAMEVYIQICDAMSAILPQDQSRSLDFMPSLLRNMCEKDGYEEARRYLERRIGEFDARHGEFSFPSSFMRSIGMGLISENENQSKAFEFGKSYFDRLRENAGNVGSGHASFLRTYAQMAGVVGEYAEGIAALDFLIGSGEYFFNTFENIRVCSQYGLLYNDNDQPDKGYEAYLKAFGLARDYVLDNFLTMTSEERASFWNNAFSFFRQELPSAAERGGYTPRYASLAYDAALFSSGLLLASDITVADAVEESGDRNTRRLYSDFVKQKALYEKASEASALRDDEAVRRAVELKAKAKDAEKKLLSRLSDRLGNYNRSLAIEWKDVRDALGKDEAAVEFIEMPVAQYSIYLALVLRPGYDAPVMKRLFLRDNSPSSEYTDPFEDCYNSPVLTGLLWKPLVDELQGCSSVWFAPQGKLTVTAIESLPGMEEITGRSDTRYRRLTSTRELVRLDSRKPGSCATLYGDIDFALDAEGMIRASGKRDLGTREAGGGIGELPGTGEEAEYLESLLKETSGFTAANTQYLKRDKATETSFKRLSGKAPRLLHVGTHGYFASEGDVRGSEYFNRSLAGGVAPEDLAMMRSGLLFAGAEGTLYEDRVLPDNVDNGVLTAREIASLRLQGVDLTVLSACETGLGEVGSDGVFGLQRGLKKAGAGAVMMSLWKVSDDSTTALMKSFYRHWLREGMDKQAALDAAKADVRRTPGWEHPQYWAPFILLDALD